ncbi:Hypothetical protein LUCI_2797 [Lucifera butyrica]|uniref:DUF2229 domain-containing protein n=1 Tax=Lucifera butyrica TaxID=1351585 RepID=A0A498RBM1_9FIRM|nr:acyl-CoA dehydratase activase-related protein [Lucifera butyrica]VBB07533.1 Hypothetical protein LUCI_2797 [Lucifera butyrica]
MQVHVGIPQAMLYHEFGSLWTAFFKNMGLSVSVSAETNKQILDRGTLLAIDESCLPLKVYLGHVDFLLSRCSHIFVPRIAQYHQNYYFCAKFAGLPDIVRNTFHLPAEQVISPNIENKSAFSQLQAVHTTCRALGLPLARGCLAYRRALKSWRADAREDNPSLNRQIAVIGHSYLLKDAFLSGDILKMLASRGIDVVTPEQVPDRVLYREAKVFEPEIYWQLSSKLAGAAQFFCRQTNIVGVVVVSSFACGPDSLVNEYLEHHVFKKSNKPYMIVTIDEHTGQAGLITRMEAFLDLLEWGAPA